MPPRQLGGGRILGSGKALAAAPPPSAAAPPAHHRSSSLLTPSSESNLSSSSQNSATASPLATSPLADTIEHLGSSVSLGNGTQRRGGSAAAAAAASSKLLCPICNEEMVTLLQLNRHLDDSHQELPEIEQDEVKNWFNKQVVKAKRFQPLAVINQKLKGLDVFESNGAIVPPSAVATRSTTSIEPPDADEVVTRAYWQRSGYNDICTDPACGKRLGAVNGNVNCRKCGRLFCEEHTMYQIKLSRSAQHEPVRGYWCRVCETCYKSRDGYNDHNGLIREHTTAFLAHRRKTVDKAYLEIARLEKRLTRLTQLLANPPPDVDLNGGGIMAFSGQKNPRKALEQSVVSWEEDLDVLKCPFCKQDFGSWSFRRHHCRLCGRVICADMRTGCSREVILDVSAKSRDTTSLAIRMCRDCISTVFGKRDFAEALLQKPPDQRAYENLVQFEKGIRLLLPSFQRLLVALQDPEKPPSHNQLTEASKVRKRLIDSFAKYDLAARRVRDLPTTSSTQQALQKAVHQQASNFLHLHMLPLKSLPKVLKHASPHGMPPTSKPGAQVGALASIKYNDIDAASQVSAGSSSAVSALETEEKELKTRLIVLEEQQFLVGQMIADANKRRKFDEAAALQANLTDLAQEIDQVNGMLSQLDFAGAYTS